MIIQILSEKRSIANSMLTSFYYFSIIIIWNITLYTNVTDQERWKEDKKHSYKSPICVGEGLIRTDPQAANNQCAIFHSELQALFQMRKWKYAGTVSSICI